MLSREKNPKAGYLSSIGPGMGITQYRPHFSDWNRNSPEPDEQFHIEIIGNKAF